MSENETPALPPPPETPSPKPETSGTKPPPRPAPYSVEEIKSLTQEQLSLDRVKATIGFLGCVAGELRRSEVLLARAAKYAQSQGAGLVIPSIPLHPKGKLQIRTNPSNVELRWLEPGPGIIVANRMPKGGDQ